MVVHIPMDNRKFANPFKKTFFAFPSRYSR